MNAAESHDLGDRVLKWLGLALVAVVVGYFGVNMILALAIGVLGFPEEAIVVEELEIEPGTHSLRVRHDLTNLPLQSAVTYRLYIDGVASSGTQEDGELSVVTVTRSGTIVLNEGGCDRGCSGPRMIVVSVSNPSTSPQAITVTLEVSVPDGIESSSLIELDVGVLDQS